uniref:Peptidase M1 leukotriene A4 hydrolase/aminopeptidase C-terminal domain-containing protein n=1 Tax=Arcella intermedia TaxID=1963864 RepID=A0A6B2L094_9EUKA
MHLELRIDFGLKVLFGSVTHRLRVVKEGAAKVSFDTKNLVVRDVALAEGGKLDWGTPRSHPALGVELEVRLPAGVKPGEEVAITVFYSTTPQSSAIQWFEPHQTAGKAHPYCYTQCQAILARTLLPCMDTPSVKATYSVDITVPSPLIAVASGNLVGSKASTTNGAEWTTFSFNQPVRIPSYLIALASGALQKAPIGPRSSVWTEKELLDRSVFEYSAHTEKFVATLEKKFPELPYIWGTYDLLVLPTAFPYGGMENPQLTFLNASLLTGDHSLVDVVAHEIAHSWSGNLVTNATWRDFWLNEGFTMYLERVLVGEVVAGDDYRLFHIFLGYKELVRVISDFLADGETNFTSLRPNLLGVDPDDAFSIVPYEKGCLFVFYLETIVGGKEEILKWIGAMYGEHKFGTINVAQMKGSFLKYFEGKVDGKVLGGIDWNAWLEGTGLPPFDPTGLLQTKYSQECDGVVKKWVQSKDGADLAESDIAHFKPSQVMFCLDELVTSSAMPISHEVLSSMERNYKFFSSNVEVAHRFIGLALKSKFPPAVEAVAKFLPQHGRGRYIKYLFNCLNDYDHQIAVQQWKINQQRYHDVIVNAFANKLAN